MQWAAQALPGVGVLPPALRKVASFAPQRRARLGGTQILAALADDEFRGRLLTHLSTAEPVTGVIAALGERPEDVTAHDPVDVATVLWLQRPEGWAQAYVAASARYETSRQEADLAGEAEHRARLERRLETLDAETDALRREHKAQLDAARAENSTLRRRLGEARAQMRTAQEAGAAAETARQEAEQRAATAGGSAEAEVRRLRKLLEETQAQVSAQRAEQRHDRDDASLRARLLLDTVVSAAQGLQRELGLPAAEGSLAQRYEAAAEGSRITSAAGVLGTTSPALLEQLMAMPRARVIIDGYNVTKQAWGSSSLEVQRLRLVNGLAPVVARTGAEVTVVFDAAGTSARPVVAAPRGVRVMFSPENVIADDVIRDLVALEPAGRVVVVVTSDQAVARDVRRSGASVMESIALAGLLTR